MVIFGISFEKEKPLKSPALIPHRKDLVECLKLFGNLLEPLPYTLKFETASQRNFCHRLLNELPKEYAQWGILSEVATEDLKHQLKDIENYLGKKHLLNHFHRFESGDMSLNMAAVHSIFEYNKLRYLEEDWYWD